MFDICTLIHYCIRTLLFCWLFLAIFGHCAFSTEDSRCILDCVGAMKTAIKRFLQGNESYDSAQTLITVFMPCKRTLSLSAALQNILTVGLSIVQRRLTGLNLICYVQLIVQKLFLS